MGKTTWKNPTSKLLSVVGVEEVVLDVLWQWLRFVDLFCLGNFKKLIYSLERLLRKGNRKFLLGPIKQLSPQKGDCISRKKNFVFQGCFHHLPFLLLGSGNAALCVHYTWHTLRQYLWVSFQAALLPDAKDESLIKKLLVLTRGALEVLEGLITIIRRLQRHSSGQALTRDAK